MAHRPRRQLASLRSTLVVSLVLAGTFGAIVYFASSALPYLALSPTTDPTFGAQNECVRAAMPQRLGFAVSRDAQRVAAWNGEALVVCGPATDPTATRVPLPGVVSATFDTDGHLWAAAKAADAGVSSLFLLAPDGPQLRGEVRPLRLAGTAAGVLALEPGGRLVSVRADGEVLALVDLSAMREPLLQVSADGERAALAAGGAIAFFDVRTLEKLSASAPCEVETVWWLKGGHKLLVSCGPDASWALTLDADTGQSETAVDARTRREPSVLAGPGGPWVQACDNLACTAPEP